MKVSDEMLEMIKAWEGFRAKAYRCPAGVLTFGYGHTGADVKAGMQVTPAEAEALLRSDLRYFEAEVGRLTAAVRLSQHQFDALVSFAFNCGAGALKSSTLLRKVLADAADPGIGAEFKRWNR
ncbi:MAG: lysozyme, partial [Muribaculaceae bacterium]|nr:lysozyme [Muribaculaceae bacterium]